MRQILKLQTKPAGVEYNGFKEVDLKNIKQVVLIGLDMEDEEEVKISPRSPVQNSHLIFFISNNNCFITISTTNGKISKLFIF